MPKKAAKTSRVTSEPVEDEEGSPAVKRARKAQPRVKGKKGALQVVMTLPVDLIWEICTHLGVGDLLALSNTSKSFRAVVTGEGSRALFQSARRRAGLPELESEMTDLQYAELIYGKGCHICHKGTAGKVDPSFRARICTACLKDAFIGNTHKDQVRLDKLNEFTTFCVQHTVAYGKGSAAAVRYHLGDLDRVSAQLDRDFPITSKEQWEAVDHLAMYMLEINNPGSGERKEEMRKLRAVLKANSEYVETLVYAHDPAHATPPAPQGEFQTWFLELHRERKKRDKDTAALAKWLQEQEQLKGKANENIRLERRAEIERRLESIGFEKSEFLANEFLSHAQVKSTRPLSDRTYSTNVEPVLRAALEENRRARIRTSLTRQFEREVLQQNQFFFPPAQIYLQLPSISPVVDNVSENPPDDIAVSASTKSAALEEISNLVRARHERLVRGIVSAYHEIATELNQGKMNYRQNPTSEPTSVKYLSLALPRLPPWVPRTDEEPIVASDKQLSNFLETSSLARFECVKCEALFTTRGIFVHHSRISCCSSAAKDALRQSQTPGSSTAVDPDAWIAVEGQTDVGLPLVRITKETLSLSLKLQQVIERTPLVVKKRNQFRNLGPGYSLGEEQPDWYQVALECSCKELPRFLDGGVHAAPELMYEHIKRKVKETLGSKTTCKISSTVAYSNSYREKWKEAHEREKAALGRQGGGGGRPSQK
ncbi:hypothetical protein JCM11491_001403 [Sporobolomyces phaffii]